MLPAGNRPLQVFLSAGEASGDLHGAELVRSIRALQPEARITCLGGPGLRAAGAEVLVDNRDIAVVGLFEVARHLRTIHAAWRTIRAYLTSSRPHLVVLIDFPDFNFMLARLARRLGIKVFYYISPQVWAWRSGRVRTLKRYVDRMAVILPFEADYYAKRGMRVDYVGHPLLDVIARAPSVEEARRRYRPMEAQWVVGLLPGSRRSEVRTLLPIMLETAELILQRMPDVVFLLPVAPSLDREAISREVGLRGLPVRIISGDAYGAIRASDLIITASGTVTLEAAILGTPMLITYRLSNLSYPIGRRLIKVNHAGLPNLIAGRIIAPEFIQHDARADLIARTALSYLESPERLSGFRRDLLGIREGLGEPGVSDRVARLVLHTARSAEVGTAQHADGALPSGGVTRSNGCEAGNPSRWSEHGGSEDLPRDAWESRRFPRFFHAINLLSLPIYPLLTLYYVVQSALRGKYRSSRLMRLGLELPRFDKTGPRIWIHALSVGETNSVAPLVQALKMEWPEVEIVFSSATETGRISARKQLSHLVSRFFYMPHDFPWAMERLIRRIKPNLFVLVETDVWPNLLRTLKHHSIPSVLVNGRLSPKSFTRMLALRPILRPVFEQFDQILVQSREDGERYVALGVSPNSVRAMGNLKFDAARAPSPEAELNALRGELGLDGERKICVAGSTHEGEEEGLFDIHKALLRRDPGLLLVVAPRDIRRGAEILKLCVRKGLSVGCRSMRDKADGVAVYILDTLGELRRVYGLADAVFIGGSLVPFGGHNPLEAVAHGKPVYWGPHLFNFREIEHSLMAADCGRSVSGPEELREAISMCLEDAAYRERVLRMSVSFMRNHGGAAGRIARFLHELCIEKGMDLK